MTAERSNVPTTLPPSAEGDAAAQARRAQAAQAYARQSREAREQQWILQHLPMVKHIVAKVIGTVRCEQDFEDLVSAGTLGLVKAARSFDTARDAEFKTYAYIRIRGAVLDELRKKSFVPAAVIAQIRRVRRICQQHLAEHGQPPSDEALARLAGLSLAELYRVLEEARKQHVLSIHGAGEGDEEPSEAFMPTDTAPSPDAQVEKGELRQRLARAIRELPERDRVLLILYYQRDLTMKETAQVLGVTESRVSQLHAAAVFRLSMILRDAP